ncbi:MAG: EamA family transporter RarD [Planctomycetia bacterium]|nr:EamA family transporter RarD [Planctomycetia bacterium]
MEKTLKQGMLFGLTAYGLWGVIPIYFRMLTDITKSYEILAHRVVWSALFLICILVMMNSQWGTVISVFRRPRMLLTLLLSSVLIALNWFVYIYGVETKRVVHCSLGYFITPLVNVALGVILLNEKIRFWQGIALGCGVVGMLLMASLADSFPWIALSLAATFSSYGLMRKLQPVDTLTGVTIETWILAPIAVLYLFMQGTAWQTSSRHEHWLLILSGPATVIPLFCFGQAARLLPLSTLGFLQYLSPSMQFLVAVFYFHEPMNTMQAMAFAVVWVGLLIYSFDLVLAQTGKKRIKKLSKGE